MILLLILSLTCATRGQSGSEPTGSGLTSDTLIPSTQSVCPLQKVKEDFDMSKVYNINNFVSILRLINYTYSKPIMSCFVIFSF